jgi:hypothetical protein
MTQRKDILAGKGKPVLPVRRLSIEIRASETHCLTWWPDPRKRCQHYGTRRFGSIAVCCLFGKDLDDAKRLPECVAAEESK